MSGMRRPHHELAADVITRLLPTLDAAAAAAAAATITTATAAKPAPTASTPPVEVLELPAHGRNDHDPDQDESGARAIAARVVLMCHPREVLSLLVPRDTASHAPTLRALCGSRRVKRSVVLQAPRPWTPPTPPPSSTELEPEAEAEPEARDDRRAQWKSSQPLVGLQRTTFRRPRRTLTFTTCTLPEVPAMPTRAVHLLQTLPETVHDAKSNSNDDDHTPGLVMAFDLRASANGDGYGSSSHTTHVLFYAAVSAAPTAPAAGGQRRGQRRRRQRQEAALAREVMQTMAASLGRLESVIRRRRLGCQSFIYLAPPAATAGGCALCRRRFGFFHRPRLCELCGHRVCKACAGLHDVEFRVGAVRQNRCCGPCLTRVDACAFSDQELVSALGPSVFATDEGDGDTWSERDSYDSFRGRRRSTSDASTTATTEIHATTTKPSGLAEPRPSRSLERLAELVDRNSDAMVAITRDSVFSCLQRRLRESLDDNERERGRLARPEACDVLDDDERPYVLDYDPTRTSSPLLPLPPRPSPSAEAQRLEHLAALGLDDVAHDVAAYDHVALDLLAEVAAKRLQCSMGIVSVIGADMWRAVGAYALPTTTWSMHRHESLCAHGLVADKPLVVKNPQRDVRFAHMPNVRALGIRFYVGFPIRAPDGTMVASLCSLDDRPHRGISARDYATMEALARLAGDLLFLPPPPPPLPPPPPSSSTT